MTINALQQKGHLIYFQKKNYPHFTPFKGIFITDDSFQLKSKNYTFINLPTVLIFLYIIFSIQNNTKYEQQHQDFMGR